MKILNGLALTLILSGAAVAQEVNVSEGRNLYMTYCSQCHGAAATGNGPMAEMLAIPTPDLTRLAQANGGVFPNGDIAMKIDGRSNVLAHGGAMPLFGPALEADQQASLRLANQQSLMVALPLAQVLLYLASVQDN